jgi:hypothetical protein
VESLILVLLIPVAYYVGRFMQWRSDFRQTMRMMRQQQQHHRR